MIENTVVSERKDEQTSNLEKELQLEENDKKHFHKIVLDSYFSPKSFERKKNGKFYEKLGVKRFQKAIMSTIGLYFRKEGIDKKPSQYFIGEKSNVESLRKFEKGTRFNELIHAPGIGLTGYLLSKELSEENYALATFYGTLFLINSYSIMLQRYNRARIHNVIEHKEKKKKD